jgi:hypothetical protein
MRLALGSKEIELELECKGRQNVTLFWMLLEVGNRNRNKFINQIRAPGGHIQITIMIDTQQLCK